jgi:signal transduction histidine kinase
MNSKPNIRKDANRNRHAYGRLPFSPGGVPLRDSLQLKLFIPVFCGLVILIVIQARILVNTNRTQYLGAMENRLQTASLSLEHSMVEAMIFGDHNRGTLEGHFDEAVTLAGPSQSGLVSRLVDLQGHRMAGASSADESFGALGFFVPPAQLSPVQLRNQDGLGVAVPVMNRTTCRRCHAQDGETLGWITVAVSLQELASGEEIIQRTGVLTVLVLSIVFGLTIWALMFIHVSRPLAELQGLMGRVMKGDLKVRYKVEGRDELARLGERFNLMVQRLDEIDKELQEATAQLMMRAEKMVNVGELASRLAHEIRNPLAGIESVVSIFLEDLPEDDPERDILRETLSQIHRIENTLNDLLSFARPKPARFKTVAVEDMLTGIVAFCRDGNITGIHEIEFTPSGDLPPLRADQDMLNQAFLNVIMNGFQVMSEPGTVIIQAGVREVVGRGQEVWVSIADTGPGIPPEVLPHVFNAFFTTRTRGTGLGLAITRTIVNKHGADLRVERTGPEGTEFLFTFPVSDSDPTTREQ